MTKTRQAWGAPIVGLALMVLSACGGAEFQRTPGTTVYPALPPGTPVALLKTDASLAHPVVVVGTLRLQDTSGEVAKVKQDLQIAARRKGCDAIVGLSSTSTEQRKVVEESGLDASGKPTVIKKEKRKRLWVWQGRCVRSAHAGVAGSAAVPSDWEPTEAEAAPPAELATEATPQSSDGTAPLAAPNQSPP